MYRSVLMLQCCRNLQYLSLAYCDRFTDNGFLYLTTGKGCHNLIHLNLSGCTQDVCFRVSDVGIFHLTGVSSVNKLQELNVSHCSLITDISVKRIAERLCKLHHLNLSYCVKLTNTSLEWLNGSSICSLDISGCNIQDKGLDAVEGTHLRKLVLAECVHITDLGIEMTDNAVKYVTTGSRYLRELDVSGCVLLTDRSVQLLERICPPLRSIAMTCCCNISKVAALKLQPCVKHWEHSNDYTPYWFGNDVGIVHPITRPINTDVT
ncbi:hypothetical protein F2P81_007138 [Scophthalmus maximus]|uniref:F-box/LRR-repeat protein 15-like leucin rich repeat domain-containing protein n=1 Tax=Scophthalmus maximus TaxID=52904 RepID=A0A6A4TBP3_SCOMX|nr:hypothetical protein F2P81_007138 [Scophthalmus maximus]